MSFKRKALYAGSFDPLTNGHLDIIARSAHQFDQLFVAVATNENKKTLFTSEERLKMAKKVLNTFDNVSVIRLSSGLTVNLAHQLGCQILIRGVRNATDLEFEMSIANMNKLQAPTIETLLLMSDKRYQFLSSSIIKEVARAGGDISGIVPAIVAQAIQEKRIK